MKEKSPFQVLQEESPEVSKSFFDFLGTLSAKGGLDEKTFQLVYIGIQASRGEVGSVSAHTVMAKKAGATREEVKGAVLISLMVSGVSGVASCLIPALEAYDSAK